MAATTKLIQLRPIYRPCTTAPPSIHFSSSSSSNTPDPDESSAETSATSPPPPSPQYTSSFSSYFSDVRAKLKQPQGNPQSQPPRSPFSFSSSTSSAPRSPSRISDLEEIRKNLSEFRRRSAVPPPPPTNSPSQSPQQLSIGEFYQRNVASRDEESSSAGSKSVGKLSIEAIRESLRQLRTSTGKNQNERAGQMNDSLSLSRFKDSLKLKPGNQSQGDSSRVIGGGDKLPLSIFGAEIREKEGGSSNAAMRIGFLKTYNPKDLGERLKVLRPDKKGDWFSLQELNERLMKLREIEEKERENEPKFGGIYSDLRESLQLMKKTEDEKATKNTQRLEILSQIGRTPSYMLLPPKEHLVEKFFHPDNMSASEKLKLELKKVRDEFKMSESDCGSARVQVAQLTTKIKHLSTVLHKKDKHSRKGLLGMVQKRKTLLKYLRRTDWESYSFVLSKLGLRDNPDYKN